MTNFGKINTLFPHYYTCRKLSYHKFSSQYFNNLDKLLDKVFNNHQKYYVKSLLNDSSIYFYDKIVDSAKFFEPENFLTQINQNFIQVEYARFYHKINKIYCNPEMSLSLDKGSIDIEILDVFKQWKSINKKYNDPHIKVRRDFSDWEYFSLPLTRAMLNENILLCHKYNKQVEMEQYIYNYFVFITYDLFKIKKLGRNIFSILYFYLVYSPFYAFKFSIDYFAIGQRKQLLRHVSTGHEMEVNQWMHGTNLKWDIPTELYKKQTITPYRDIDGSYTSNMH